MHEALLEKDGTEAPMGIGVEGREKREGRRERRALAGVYGW
ncbi:hypothetical protein O166_19720 [Pseudogulbenkiania ferrooxidans EGD-HP2]|uniref:Uncharacterized protein n=1 Tax=Pseudogulbenkiania ferrooxidans EGD-HP2 TaxID=1388764 RepID=A0ABP2XRW1_9NEIS|nr:hypothetical protein O166_19720 [Pseudogulbenkiania ferrooxidans EGD-HP2]